MSKIEHAWLPFRFGGANVPYLQTQQQIASRQQSDILKSKRLGETQHSFREWLKNNDDEFKIGADTRCTETTDVTANNIIMSLPKYKTDLDKLNCYLYQTTNQNHFPDPKTPSSVQKSKSEQTDDLSSKAKSLNSLRPPRYGKQTELWQQMHNSEWDRNQTRDSVTSVPATLPDSKKQVFKNQICRKSIYPGEWVEPEDELISSVINKSLSEQLKIPHPGYTGKTRFYDTNWKEIKDNTIPNFYRSSSKTSHAEFPKYEYRPSQFGRKSELSKTVDVSSHQSPFGNSNPPVRTGTWDNYLYQPRWT